MLNHFFFIFHVDMCSMIKNVSGENSRNSFFLSLCHAFSANCQQFYMYWLFIKYISNLLQSIFYSGPFGIIRHFYTRQISVYNVLLTFLCINLSLHFYSIFRKYLLVIYNGNKSSIRLNIIPYSDTQITSVAV